MRQRSRTGDAGGAPGTILTPSSPLTATVVVANAGNVAAGRVVEGQLAFLDQRQDRRRSSAPLSATRSGRWCPASSCVWLPCRASQKACSARDLAVPQHQRDGAAEAIVIDELLEHPIDPIEAVRREPGRRRRRHLGRRPGEAERQGQGKQQRGMFASWRPHLTTFCRPSAVGCVG